MCGSGVYIKDNRTATETKLCFPAGRYGSSFRAETVALMEALKWLKDNDKLGRTHVFTDSRSLVQKLQSGRSQAKTAIEKSIWTSMQYLTSRDACSMLVQWLPSHCGIPGNETADVLANEGCKKHKKTSRSPTELQSPESQATLSLKNGRKPFPITVKEMVCDPRRIETRNLG